MLSGRSEEPAALLFYLLDYKENPRSVDDRSILSERGSGVYDRSLNATTAEINHRDKQGVHNV